MPKLDSKGVAQIFIFAAIGVVVIIGLVLLSNSKKSSNSKSASQQIAETNASPSTKSEVVWEDYKDEGGYSLKKPQEWIVENSSENNTKLIKISSPDKSASVLIEAIAGPALSSQEELDKVVDQLEEKLKNDPKYKVDQFSKKSGEGISGYSANGEIGPSDNPDQKILFEDIFLIAKNGRGLRRHAIYAAINKDRDRAVVTEIMKSFKTD